MSASARIAYIVSRAHSGSTLLDLLLSSHSQVFSVGEAKMFAQEPGKLCTCGADSWTTCSFWTAVDEVMRKGGASGVASGEIESHDPAIFAAYNRRFFDAVAEVSEKSVILDSSKDYSRLRRMLRSGLELEPLHLLRHPCGVAFSNMRKGARLGRECRLYVKEHLSASHALRGREHVEVRYEALAQDPQGELERIMPALGLAFEPEQLRGWKARERHNFGGNRMRFDSSEEIRLDDAWRRELSAWQKLSIRMRTFPVRFRRGVGSSLVQRLLVADHP